MSYGDAVNYSRIKIINKINQDTIICVKALLDNADRLCIIITVIPVIKTYLYTIYSVACIHHTALHLVYTRFNILLTTVVY